MKGGVGLVCSPHFHFQLPFLNQSVCLHCARQAQKRLNFCKFQVKLQDGKNAHVPKHLPGVWIWTSSMNKNIESEKMKPTSPNVDTYVKGEKQYLPHFLADIVVGNPGLTHWFVTHSGRTLLRNTLVRHFYFTRLFDTLVIHSCAPLLWGTLTWQLLLDMLSWHCCRRLLLDTPVGHSYLTRFLDSRVGHSTWDSCRTLILDALVGHPYLTFL